MIAVNLPFWCGPGKDGKGGKGEPPLGGGEGGSSVDGLFDVQI